MTRKNLPNKLTIFRIISVPFVIFLLLIDRNVPALALFLFSSITDFVDGYLARKSDQISPFGKFADPIADKLLVAGVLITFIQLGELTAIPVVIIIARGFLVTGVRLLGSKTGKVISASWLGKVKTISHIGLIIAIMLNAEFDFTWLNMAIPSLVYFAVTTAVVSGVDYLYRNRKLIKESFSG
ncbi:CDP-diacylglycerol--glycerol-3-phosphate 3-phosphatidyltransferase [Candidatus Bipolaricaulota bacterium]|nr:CDP-diacylglycerol--glycerol-3-phosphate 3-phosphatidyltransferase [Candidatus Bipolaricaulota bacterium]MBS3825438.1 CDP-diacylglycerol--glycerol-3-phosphate 3-phosphatidyltransferase [Candidatus Bipolaricaulota bacterium]